MGYFSNLDAELREYADTIGLAPESNHEVLDWSLEYAVHVTRARIEGFAPLTQAQFDAAANAALAKVESLFPSTKKE